MPNSYEELNELEEAQRISVLQGELNRCWEAYAAYSTGLRTWFVAYGVGLLALYLTDPHNFDSLSAFAKGGVAVLFAVGAFAQIVVALRNKMENYEWFDYWDHYFEKTREPPATSGKPPTIRLDHLLDWLSVVCFFGGTCWLGFLLFSASKAVAAGAS